MSEAVFLHRDDDNVVTVAPAGAPTVHDPAIGLDTLVLEVIGGHLSWSLLSGQRIPAAVLHDPEAAQDWLWAVYGEPVALAVADDRTGELPAAAALPELTEAAWQLGYAHWAAHWWPASTIDGIPALDPDVLARDIAALTESCDAITDGADAQPPPRPSAAAPARRQDYALAAGSATGTGRPGLVLATGTAGWDWRRCPPGIVDASEYAVSWRLTRDAGSTTVDVHAAAAPQLDTGLPAHLWPRARVVTRSLTLDLPLRLDGDTWTGTTRTDAEEVVRVDLHVPAVGPAITGPSAPAYGPAQRQRIRDFVVSRLRAPRSAPRLEAEIAAAASDSDF
ncbi:hypothetical protein [Nocardia spumae]|uniref:hypothetical protein n=1 Tax=Nocardia spumae TaxID=2887190 RepID=UPI001D146BF1|nr:hypothetical protein [Nocardia spumae]